MKNATLNERIAHLKQILESTTVDNLTYEKCEDLKPWINDEDIKHSLRVLSSKLQFVSISRNKSSRMIGDKDSHFKRFQEILQNYIHVLEKLGEKETQPTFHLHLDILPILKQNLSDSQIQELSVITSESGLSDEEKRKLFLDKIKNFGESVASNILANLFVGLF